MFINKVFWNFDAGVQKNISIFYPILYETFSNSCDFPHM